MSRCSVCANPLVSEVDALLGSGTPVRRVSQITGIPRSTVARHAQHAAPSDRRLGLIRSDGAPQAPADPLDEALALAARARTARERLRALEQVRAATKMKLSGPDGLDAEARERLDRNVAEAGSAYWEASDFETQARALSGWGEALKPSS